MYPLPHARRCGSHGGVLTAGEHRLVVCLQKEADHFADELIRPGWQSERSFLSVLLGDVGSLHWLEPVALVAHRINDAADPGHGHAVRGLPAGPGRHRSVVGVNPPVGHQVHLRAEQLPVQLVTRQAAPAALSEDIQNSFGFLHYAILPVIGYPVTWPPSPLRTAFPSSSAGRDSCDYYGACVTLGLAPLRRSHVRPCHT